MRSIAADRFSLEPSGPLRATVEVPGSKSLAIRALAVATLADGTSRLTGDLAARDVAVVAEACAALGAGVTRGESTGVTGTGGRSPVERAVLDLEDCGTGARLLTALAAFAGRRVRLDGSARLRERPFEALLEPLRTLGARITGGPGLPLEIEGTVLPGGRVVEVAGESSSQFVSALLIVGPLSGLEVRVTGRAVSRPYVDLTVAVMTAFGARVDRPADGVFRIAPGGYRACDYAVEGDASAAAFWLAAAAVSGGEVRVANLPGDTRQPDGAMRRHLEALGCETESSPAGVVARGPARRGADLDLRDTPDLMPALAAVAATVPERTRLTGAPHLVLKESDRIGAMAEALSRLGARVVARPDGLEIRGGSLRGAEIDPRGDHRIAMAGAVLALVVPGVVVLDPACTAKSDPGFLERLARAAAGA